MNPSTKPKPKRFAITQRMIDAGVRGNAIDCPVALSLRHGLRLYPKHNLIYVGRYTVRIGNRPFVMLNLPDRMTEFILTFDKGEPVKPTSFVLDIPEIGWTILESK